MQVELFIQHNNVVYIPPLDNDISWVTERSGTPGQLTFSVIEREGFFFDNGDSVSLKVDGKNVFYGFIFSVKTEKNHVVNVTAYDQLRYLKNKDTYVYENKTAGEVIKMIAADFHLQVGDIENTGYKIASQIEDNVTLFDIIENALDITLRNTKRLYVCLLYTSRCV